MVWAMVAQAALAVGTSYMQAKAEDKMEKAQRTLTHAHTEATNKINQANADAANRIRAGSNAFAVAQASLQNLTRSLDNREKSHAFGQHYNALVTNQGRMADAMVHGRLASRMQAASALGALRADAAARGVGGRSSDLMREVMALQAGAALTESQDNAQYTQYDALLQKQGLIRTAVNSQDQGQSLPNLDYGINVAPVAFDPISPSQYRGSAFGRAVTGFLGTSHGANGTGWDMMGDIFGSLKGKTGKAKAGGFIQAGQSTAALA